MITKLHPGEIFPQLELKDQSGNSAKLGKPGNGFDWQMLVIYRGAHAHYAPNILQQLVDYRDRLAKLEIELIAVSGDSPEQLARYLEKLKLNFPLYQGLSVAEMKQLGLYLSVRENEDGNEQPFSEPGLFIVNQQGQLLVVDISNNPFVHPELEVLVSGLELIRDPARNYLIRGAWL